MKQKYYVLPQLIVACLIFLVSIYKASSVKYAFSQTPSPTPSSQKTININYQLPDPNITPESPMWPVLALMDRADTSPKQYLENADIRLVAGKEMVEKGKVEEGYVVLEKAEQYLLESYKMSSAFDQSNNKEFLFTIALAALKHREVLEGVMAIAPDDGRAVVTRIMDTPKMIYDAASVDLESSGLTSPTYPF